MQGQTIGIIGGGQLGQMLTFSAKAGGMKVVILDPDPTCPAGQAADRQIVAPYDSFAAIDELAETADVLTYEFENVDLEALEKVAAKVSIPQGTELLRITKDRVREKAFLAQHGLKVVDNIAISAPEEIDAAVAKLGYPSILKTCEGGYDGKGQMNLKSVADLPEARQMASETPCILESFLPFKMECSVMVGRNPDGATTVFPVSENIHRNHILHESIVPARLPADVCQSAQNMAVKIAEALDLCGILGVEMFVAEDNSLYVNELAPRPHNSGHYSIEACNFSQFDVHNRAICNWPLPKIELLSSVVMVNVLGQHVAGCRELIGQKPEWSFHDYGKAEVRTDRKMGHVTILTDDLDASLQKIKATGVWDRKRITEKNS